MVTMTKDAPPANNLPTDNNLTQMAMLADLKVSSWSINQHDKQVTHEVAANAGADANQVGKFIKKLLGKEAIREINAIGIETRKAHYNLTMPWDDNGQRLLPVARFNEYKVKMDEGIDKRIDARNKFVAEYPRYIQEAQNVLGSLFRQEDYPPVDSIVAKFTMSYSFRPVPDVTHYSLNLSRQENSLLRADLEKQIQERMAAAVDSLYRRLEAVVRNCTERLDNAPGEDAKIFRNSLITNLTELLDVLPDLNITGDQNLDQIAADTRTALEGITANTLRPGHKDYDAEKTEQFKETMAKAETRLAGYFGGV